MKIKFKKSHPDAVVPSYSKEGDAGLDMVAVNVDVDSKTGLGVYRTGIKW